MTNNPLTAEAQGTKLKSSFWCMWNGLLQTIQSHRSFILRINRFSVRKWLFPERPNFTDRLSTKFPVLHSITMWTTGKCTHQSEITSQRAACFSRFTVLTWKRTNSCSIPQNWIWNNSFNFTNLNGKYSAFYIQIVIGFNGAFSCLLGIHVLQRARMRIDEVQKQIFH